MAGSSCGVLYGGMVEVMRRFYRTFYQKDYPKGGYAGHSSGIALVWMGNKGLYDVMLLPF